MSATLTSSQHLPASEFVLQSFNLLDTRISGDLTQVTNNLIDIRTENLPDNYYQKYITEQTSQQINQASFSVCNTQQESYQKIAASFGVSGSFGFYSGSVQSSVSSESFKSATSFNSSSVGFINVGTTRYNQAIDASIFQLLKPELKNQLESITSIDAAHQFVQLYGTHIALGWNLGGCFSIQIRSNTTTYADKLALTAAANAKYSSVSSVSASATAAYNLQTSESSYTLQETIYTAGGSAALAAQINLSNNTGIDAWLASCSPQTTYGMYDMLSFADLANRTGMTAASTILEQYYNLCILAYSLQNPVVYTAETTLVPGNSTSIAVAADKDFKIVSGGATLDRDVTSWLTDCYPVMSGNQINSWMAGSHDCINPASSSNYLTGYAIAVYDPGNLLQVNVLQQLGNTPGIGDDILTVSMPAPYTVTGGGCQTVRVSGNNNKFMMCSYPVQGGWYGVTTDYMYAAETVDTYFYAIGINCAGLTITPTLISSNNTSPQEHGNQTATLGNGINLIGGGAGVVYNSGTMGNLLQQSFPSSANMWTEYNKDAYGNVCNAVSNAYAIGLSVTINGLGSQPQMLQQG